LQPCKLRLYLTTGLQSRENAHATGIQSKRSENDHLQLPCERMQIWFHEIPPIQGLEYSCDRNTPEQFSDIHLQLV
jgi:hypothetical protein